MAIVRANFIAGAAQIVAEGLLHILPADIVRLRPAAVIVRSNIHKSDIVAAFDRSRDLVGTNRFGGRLGAAVHSGGCCFSRGLCAGRKHKRED